MFIVLSLPLWLTSKINFRPMVGPFVAAGFFMLIIFLLNAVRGANVLTSLDPNEAFTWHFQMGPIVLTSHSVTRGLFVAIRLAVPLTIGLLIMPPPTPARSVRGCAS
jgi:hypothetical protein